MNATEAIKLAMSHKGITQAQMAKSLGLKSQTAVSERLRGQNMGTVIFQRMATVCGYDIILKDPETGHTINLTPHPETESSPATVQSSAPAQSPAPARKSKLKVSSKRMVETPEQEQIPADESETPKIDLDSLLEGL